MINEVKIIRVFVPVLRFLLPVIVVHFGLFATELASASGPRFGLWVEAEGQNQPFRSKKDFYDFTEFVGQFGFSDLYCQVYRGGRSWYPSLLADDSPYRLASDQGFDPLGDTLASVRRRGTRVHAWLNVLRLNHDPNVPLLKVVGNTAALSDSLGNSILDYDPEGELSGKQIGYKLGTPGIWLDPSNPAVRRYLVETVRDLVLRYPELDGIHLDMIRYPEVMGSTGRKVVLRPEFGYSGDSISRFFVDSGRAAPKRITQQMIESLRRSEAWSAWRRAQVTLIVFEIRELLEQLSPRMELSAAVIAEVGKAHGYTFQDWGMWVARGLVDKVIPMNYTENQKLFQTRAIQHAQRVLPGQMLAGLGGWLMVGDPQQLIEQAKFALNREASGVVIFSYSNMFSTNGRRTLSAFERSVFPTIK